jgi:hypothetical protein
MAMKDFDFKQFMLQKGELVGLGAAVGLMVVFLIIMLVSAFASGSPAEKAKAVDEAATAVERAHTTRQPNPGDPDMPKDPKDKLVAFDFQRLDAPVEQVALFMGRPPDDTNRRQPEVLPLDEARTAVAHVQVRSYIFITDRDGKVTKVMGLTGEGANNPAGGQDTSRLMGTLTRGRRGGAGFGGPPAMGGLGPGAGREGGGGGLGPGAGREGGGGGLGSLPGLAGEDKQDFKQRPIDLTQLEKAQDVKLAEQVRPLRMAVIAASFPYKAQLEEFRKQLRLPSVAAVLNEPSKEVDEEAKQPLPAFRFLGVNVERRTLGPDGKPTSPWVKVDVNKDYRPYIILTGKRFEPDPPKYDRVVFPGLVMPRLLQFGSEAKEGGMMEPGAAPRGEGKDPRERKDDAKDRGSHDKYPDVEGRLVQIKAALEELDKVKDPALIAKPPSRFSADDFDVFTSRADAGTGDRTGEGTPRFTTPPGGGERVSKPRPGTGPAGPEGAAPGQGDTVPDHCLVRVVDVTIKPGQTYEYRLQVRMANPNYQRKDVRSPTYAQGEELKSESWFTVPEKVVAPPELLYYAVDQRELEGRNYDLRKGPNYRVTTPDKDRTFLQIHKWLEVVRTGELPLLVGDWAVAERVPVYRGEYVPRQVRAEVPVWRYTRESFVIAGDPDPRQTRRLGPGIDVNFGHDRPDGVEAAVVDFEGGSQSHERVLGRTADDKPITRKVVDDSATEVLLLSPDGKLLAHDSAHDVNDKDRKGKLDRYRKRVSEVKNGKARGTGSNPFGGGT